MAPAKTGGEEAPPVYEITAAGDAELADGDLIRDEDGHANRVRCLLNLWKYLGPKTAAFVKETVLTRRNPEEDIANPGPRADLDAWVGAHFDAAVAQLLDRGHIRVRVE